MAAEAAAPDFGAATVANDVVFTSDFTGKIYAFSTATGKKLWTAQAPAGINAFPAVTQKMLLVGAGTAWPRHDREAGVLRSSPTS